MMKLSICIPAYNRANKLEELLLSILNQDYKDYEILIVEDFSPERKKISEIVKKFQFNFKECEIRYFENESNYGFDKNYRRIIELARGEYCFFMGNDDLVNKDAFASIAILDKYSDVGVIVRSYATFKNNPQKLDELFRYSKKELYLPPVLRQLHTLFEDAVASGMVYHTELAKKISDRSFDGTLLYQLYLVSKIIEENGLYLTQKLLFNKNGWHPRLWQFLKRKRLIYSKERTIISSINFVKG